MATTSSSQSKSWWRSKSFANSSQSSLGSDAKHNAQSGPSKPKESKFNTFVASAIGKKSKKPHLTIQDPPMSYMPPSPSSISSFTSPGNIHSPEPSPYFTNRPPAKSVSTQRSYEFDQRSDPYTTSEPRTPSDHPRERTSYQNSVMMFHESDPFAAGGVVMSGAGPDMNRLSVWSDSSLLDPHTKRGESSITNRMSYGSSSSNSHGNPPDAQILPQLPVVRQRSNAASIRSKRIRREISLVAEGSQAADLLAAAQITMDNGIIRTTSKSSPASLMGRPDEPGTFGRPAMPPLRPAVQTSGLPRSPAGETPMTARSDESRRRPEQSVLHRQRSESHMRNRSKSTVSTASPILFHNTRSSVSTVSSGTHLPGGGVRPLVLVRKASQPRVNLPPISSAPPTSRLPPPPLSPFLPSDEDAEDEDIDALSYLDEHKTRSSTASSMTFASIELDLDDFEDISKLAREMIPDEDIPYTPPATFRSMAAEPHPRRTGEPKSSYPSTSTAHLSSPQHNVLRKAASQASMPMSPSMSPMGKAPRKQRSFHHPRIPLPPLPSLRSSSHTPSNTPTDAYSPRQSSSSTTQPPFTRRRLFSGSSGRRISISKSSSTTTATVDDDLRSLSNLSIDNIDPAPKDIGMRSKPVMMSFSNMGNQLSLVTDNACISPMWEEMSAAPSNPKRVSHGDYMMQHIMSPAEMLKLEQQFNGERVSQKEEDIESLMTSERGGECRTPKLDIEPGDFGMTFIGGGRSKSTRPRTNSILSNMSAFGPEERTSNIGGGDELALRGLVGVAQTFGTPTKRPATATEVTRNAGWGMSSPGRSKTYGPQSARPSTAQPSFPSPPVSPMSSSSVSGVTSSGLPPPPRPRISRENQADVSAVQRTSTIPYQALSPPPRRRPTLQSIASRDGEGTSSSSIRSSRPPSAFGQKAFNRRSLAKKPSFLDIDDECDTTNDTISLADMSVKSFATTAYHTAADYAEDHDLDSSFLDLDRGTSFDTVRSFDEDIQGF
ncbi:hypothetical protein BDY19DRAFT_13940 [Irpex rosettiformis]|uniref:Uncharacterized protein n=1 Tax=Irpex rosettiformis TaxID=378272 RepID=A0ACB8UIW6_9APHY|nr:hypothetical protein BDY19DRAFT_13940 [Irpex rosettiformis]